MPAPGILSGLSLICQHLPAVLGTSLLRALGVPGGYCPEEPLAPALLAEVPDDSASDSDRGWVFSTGPSHQQLLFRLSSCNFGVPMGRGLKVYLI